jgi:hypothetical protein
MDHYQKIILFWLLTVVGMILHFNYNVSGIFYEVDIVSERAEGFIPNSVHIIRALYYHLPILFIIVMLYFKNKVISAFFVVGSIIYSLTHIAHLSGEIGKENSDPSQISLLGIVAVISILLAKEHWQWNKDLRLK